MNTIMRLLGMQISEHIDMMGLMLRSHVDDVPDGMSCVEYHPQNKRKCISCSEEFFGAKTRIECRICDRQNQPKEGGETFDAEKAGRITGFYKTNEPCDDCIGGWCQMNCGPAVVQTKDSEG